MRPLPTSPTNTFQSPKVATSDGLAGSSFAFDLAAGLALVAARAGARRALAAQTAAAANPIARRDERTKRVITTILQTGPWPCAPRPRRSPCRPIGAQFRLSPCRPAQGLQSCIWLLKNE